MQNAAVSPAGYKVLMQRLPDRSETDGGIHIPQRAVEDPWMRGLVLDVGPGFHHKSGKWIEPPVKPGDRVIFSADERYINQIALTGTGAPGSILFIGCHKIAGVLED